MIGTVTWARMYLILQKAFGSTIHFAGKCGIAIGDLQQLPPVEDKPSWTSIDLVNYNAEQILGKQFFQSFQVDFKLIQVIRQAGDSQIRFRQLLANVGRGETTMEDYEVLKTRFSNRPPISEKTIFLVPTRVI